MSARSGTSAIRNPLDDRPLGSRQIVVLVLAVLLAALDGYDALSMAFAAPSVAKDWGIGKGIIGLLLSSSLVGMAVGAIFLAPLADRIGRRCVALSALGILVVGAALSAVSRTVPHLAGARLLTGVGIGVMVAMTTLLSAEFSNARSRSVAVAAVATIGFPLGGVIGGLAASVILERASWHWVFGCGSIVGIVLLALISVTLPESPAFLTARSGPNALARVNEVLARLNQPPLARLPEIASGPRGNYAELFAPSLRGTVARLMAVASLIACASYYILNWLPALAVDAGFSPAQGSLISAQSGTVGLIGGVFFAAFTARLEAKRVASTAMVGVAIALAAVGTVPASLASFVLTAGILSFCLAGSTGILYGLMSTGFPTGLRASGMGLIMGGMRIGSAAGPGLAGWMFAQDMTRASVSLIFAVGPLIAALLIRNLPSQEGAVHPR